MSDERKDFGSCYLTRKEAVATVTLNRPEKMNALDPEIFHGIQESLAYLTSEKSIRAVIFTGAGDHFSAGGDVEKDINPLRSKTVEEFKDYFEPLAELYNKLFNLEKPTVAAVNGFALGAGMELSLMCDIRIASENMKMGEFFVKMGLVPETGMCILPKLVGLGMAKMICYTGDLIDAKEAFRIGLVQQVVPQNELIQAAEKLASRLARGPASIKIMKRAINEFSTMPLEASANAGIGYQFLATRTADHAEAVTAFLQKRKPAFTGD